MKEQFCSYEISLELKKLGFDEKCLSAYNDSKHLLIYYPNECFYVYCDIEDYNGTTYCYDDIAAPLWQQAIEFCNKELYKRNYWACSKEWVESDFIDIDKMSKSILKAIELIKTNKC